VATGIRLFWFRFHLVPQLKESSTSQPMLLTSPQRYQSDKGHGGTAASLSQDDEGEGGVGVSRGGSGGRPEAAA